MDYAFGIVSKKSFPNQKPFMFFTVLFSKTFIVLYFTFRFIIYFELIFVKDVIFMS